MDYEILDEAIDKIFEDESQDEFYQDKIGKRGRPSRYPPWTKQQMFSLILLYKQHPLLYDSTHPKYAQTVYRNKAFREIHENLLIYKPKVTIPEMRAKLKTLRSQYMKDKRKADTENYIPKFWCYEHLKFLDDRGKFLEEERVQNLYGQDQQLKFTEQPDDCYVEENENEIYVRSFDDSDVEEESVDPFASGVTEQRPKSALYQKCLDLVETLATQLDPTREQRPAALLGRMVETELSSFPEDIYDDAKWKIIKVLEEACKRNKQTKSSSD